MTQPFEKGERAQEILFPFLQQVGSP